MLLKKCTFDNFPRRTRKSLILWMNFIVYLLLKNLIRLIRRKNILKKFSIWLNDEFYVIKEERYVLDEKLYPLGNQRIPNFKGAMKSIFIEKICWWKFIQHVFSWVFCFVIFKKYFTFWNREKNSRKKKKGLETCRKCKTELSVDWVGIEPRGVLGTKLNIGVA